MREIDNNINNSSNGVNNLKGIQKPTPDEVNVNETPSSAPAESKEITDLSGPAVTLGKSQVSSDSVEKDMKFFAKNPEAVRKLDAVFEGKFLKEHSYEEATRLMDAYKNEFINK